MVFSSSLFLFLFLPASLLGYQLASRFGRGPMLAFLTFISLVFYGCWSPAYLVLLCGSIALNFAFSQALGEGRSEHRQSVWLALAITANLLLLAWYKYLFPLLNFLHLHGALPRAYANVLLPLGISFFTFTQIAYLIDLRQGIARRQTLRVYSVFVTFFPHLIAGPILHPRELMPQLEQPRRGLALKDLAAGASWFILGLAKKVLIADRIAPLANVLFAHPRAAGLSMAWLGAVTYALQLYFDFSGYSDMAVGLARMFSLRFPLNFNSPYKATSVIEFWQRWHMTLSRYLNEYLLAPILGRVSRWRMDHGLKVTRRASATPGGFASMVAFPILSTMLIAGVWHGAGLQFLIFGVLHGLYLTLNHAWRLLETAGSKLHRALPAPAALLITFSAVVVSLVFFRASSINDAIHIVLTLFGLRGRGQSFRANPFLGEIPSISHALASLPGASLALVLCLAIVWLLPNTQQVMGETGETESNRARPLPWLHWRVSATWSVCLAALLCLSILLFDASTPFLYFQF